MLSLHSALHSLAQNPQPWHQQHVAADTAGSECHRKKVASVFFISMSCESSRMAFSLCALFSPMTLTYECWCVVHRHLRGFRTLRSAILRILLDTETLCMRVCVKIAGA